MSVLVSIQDTIQQIGRALSAVLRTEVSIADENLRIIAGTDRYKDLIGRELEFGNTYYYVRSKKKSIIIENPGHEEICGSCRYYGSCPEQYEINQPILLDDSFIGIISLVAMTKKQKRRVLDNKKSLLVFLGEMAGLIAGKAAERKMGLEINRIANHLKVLLKSSGDGLLSFDRQGVIDYISPVARKQLKIEKDEGHETNKKIMISDIFPSFKLDEFMDEGTKHINRELRYETKGDKGRVISSISPIDNPSSGGVMIIKSMADAREFITDISAYENSSAFQGIICNSEEMKKLNKQAQKVSTSNSSILITGESGTGKELLARAIHKAGKPAGVPFISVNCAAIPSDLLESELFGYEEGAFTGAKKGGKQGKLELANDGTLFLDEIGDMSLHLQSKLLRVLQNESEERTVTRLGGVEEIKINVRIISATNKDLKKLISKNRFREDLYYRLNVIPLHIPPLRERKTDINALCDYFIKKHSQRMKKQIRGLTEDVRRLFRYYEWPGNIRELENAVEYAINMAEDEYIFISDLPSNLQEIHHQENDNSTGLDHMIKKYEKMIIRKTLDKYENSVNGKRRAAEELNISLPSIYRKLRE